MRVFVTGGTGLIGRRLVPTLLDRGDEVLVLSRSPDRHPFGDRTVHMVEGDPIASGPWQGEVAGCDAVIHLAGENVMSHRWNDAQKARIRDSRVHGTRHVVEAIGGSEGRCKTLASASAIGYYGSRGDEKLDESAPPGEGFLADVCREWEAEAQKAGDHGARVTMMRTGGVLDPTGGALGEVLPVMRKYIGGPIGSGNQWFSWIHHEDIVGLYCMCMDDDSVEGAVNGCSPNPVTNREFVKALGRVMNRPTAFRVPEKVIKMAIGEAVEIVLSSQRLVPKVALDHGYEFRHPEIEPALRDLLGKR